MRLVMPMALWKRLLLALAAFLLILVLSGFLVPARARVERTVSLHSTPLAVYEEVATLKGWPKWSAWTVARFPDMTTRFEDPESGGSGPDVPLDYTARSSSTGYLADRTSVCNPTTHTLDCQSPLVTGIVPPPRGSENPALSSQNTISGFDAVHRGLLEWRVIGIKK